MSTDEALIEQIARASCGSPSDYEWRTWGEDDPGLRAITLQYAARLLPIIRKAERDAARGAALAMTERFQYGGWSDALVNGDKIANANHVTAWLRNDISTHYPEDVTP